MPSSPSRQGFSVTIVSNHKETLHGLEEYLARAGIRCNGTRSLGRILDLTPPSTAVVVVFPDEYPSSVVDGSLSLLHRDRPHRLVVIVTNEPQRFERGNSATGTPGPLVIPKPAWAWTILDAIRARLDSTKAAS